VFSAILSTPVVFGASNFELLLLHLRLLVERLKLASISPRKLFNFRRAFGTLFGQFQILPSGSGALRFECREICLRAASASRIAAVYSSASLRPSDFDRHVRLVASARKFGFHPGSFLKSRVACFFNARISKAR